MASLKAKYFNSNELWQGLTGVDGTTLATDLTVIMDGANKIDAGSINTANRQDLCNLCQSLGEQNPLQLSGSAQHYEPLRPNQRSKCEGAIPVCIGERWHQPYKDCFKSLGNGIVKSSPSLLGPQPRPVPLMCQWSFSWVREVDPPLWKHNGGPHLHEGGGQNQHIGFFLKT